MLRGQLQSEVVCDLHQALERTRVTLEQDWTLRLQLGVELELKGPKSCTPEKIPNDGHAQLLVLQHPCAETPELLGIELRKQGEGRTIEFSVERHDRRINRYPPAHRDLIR